MHLEEIAFHVAPGAHAVVILDQAGWHGSAELVVPSNITLLPLPPRCPELTPVENVWLQQDLQILRRHRRPLLLCLEQTPQPAMAHHVHRHAPVGPWVIIIAPWYYEACARVGVDIAFNR